MATLNELKQQIRDFEAVGDYKNIIHVRAQIARDFPGTTEAAEALYRLGIYFLFLEENFEAAAETFEDAIKTNDVYWSKAARVSLASLYLKDKKPQKSLLELRKVAFDGEKPSIHSISALSLMEMIFSNENNEEERFNIKLEKIKHLKSAIESQKLNHPDDLNTIAYYNLMVGFEVTATQGANAGQMYFKEVLKIAEESEKVSAEIIKQATDMLQK